jgi:hypothetical protein
MLYVCRRYEVLKLVKSVSYIYIYIYIHACIHAYIHTYMHAYMHAYIHTYIVYSMWWLALKVVESVP